MTGRAEIPIPGLQLCGLGVSRAVNHPDASGKSIPSLPSSDEAGCAGTAGKPRARKSRKKKETAEDE
jgi:hypothetical protein